MSRERDDGRGCQARCLNCQMDLHDLCDDPTGCHLDEDSEDQRQGGEAIDRP
jgi:hypothetical protein